MQHHRTLSPIVPNWKVLVSVLVTYLMLIAPLAPVAASAVRSRQPNNSGSRRAEGQARGATASQSAQSPSAQPTPAAVSAVNITATKADSFADSDADGKAELGETVTYTVNITNSGTTDAAGVVFSDTIDPNTTFVADSAHASPLARNDTYNAVGNTLLEVGVTPSGNPSVQVAGSLFDNDAAVTDTFALQSFQATSANGGTVSVNASGNFTYLPAVNFTGTDTFTYTLRNTANTTPVLTDTGTVTITVANRVWYVNNSGSNGDGRSSSPFNSLTPVNAANGTGDADSAGDFIYLFTGGGNYTTGLVLENNQQLIGNGVALVVGANTLRGAGTRPTISTAPLTLASGNTVSGLNLSNNGTGAALSGTSVGTLTVNNMLISTTGAGLDLTGVSTPTVNVTLDSLTSSGGAKNVNLVGLNGTISLGSGALSGATGNAFDVSGGAATISFSGTITNTTARVVNIASKTGGTVTLSGLVSGTGSSTGVNLTTNTGATINFTGGVTLSTGTSSAFNATGGGTVSVTDPNATGTAPDNTLTTTTGTALNVNATTIGSGGLNFLSINSNGSANPGISLTNTGTLGGLTVSGNGGTCSSVATCTGGTIQSKSGDGIIVNNTKSLSLTRMFITANTDNNIDATTVNGMTLSGMLISSSTNHGLNGSSITALNINGTTFLNNGSVANNHGVNIINLLGASSVTNTIFDHSNTIQMFVQNTMATANAPAAPQDILTISNTTWRNHNGPNFGDHLSVESITTGNWRLIMNATGGENNFTTGQDAVQAFATSGGTLDVSLTGIDASGTSGSGINLGNFNAGSKLTFNVSGNKTANGTGISNTGGIGINATSIGGGTLSGTINDNTVTTSPNANGINIVAENNGNITTTVSNNVVTGVGNGNGIRVQIRIASAGNITISGNQVNNNDALNLEGISVEAGSSAGEGGSTICLNMLNNKSSVGAASGQEGYRLINRSTNTFQLQNFAGNGSLAADVQAWIVSKGNQNFAGGAPTSQVSFSSPPTNPYTSSAGCSLPSTRPEQVGEGTATAPSDDAPTVATATAAQDATATKSITERPFVSFPRPVLSPTTTATNNNNQTSKATAKSPNVVSSPSATLPISIGTLNANKSVTIQFQVTINNPFPAGPTSVSNQGRIDYTGGPGGGILTDDPSVGGANDPTVTPVDVISLSINDVSVAEGAVGLRTVTLKVSVTGTTPNPITVHYSTADNTATAPADYVAVPDTLLNIPGNTPSVNITVQVKGDTIFEGNENFFVNLTNVSSGTLINDGQSIVTIADDEPMTADFDGDGKTDAAVWNPANGNWVVVNSSTAQSVLYTEDWGRSSLGDIAVPGDYDGDNKIDIAIFRPSQGNWYILKSSTGYTPFIQNWGQSGDIPVPGDYDNDGRIDIAVWRPSQGNWYILKSNNGSPINTVQNWGISTDKPVRGDFDGDGKNDLAVFRVAEGNWYILNSSSGAITIVNWGTNADKLVPGDYDGDGKTDLAIYRTSGPNAGTWFIRNSSGGTTARSWGNGTDVPVPGDYDGDGKTDLGVWRATEGNWYVINSDTNTVNLQTNGLSGQTPAPNTYLPQ